jgi:carbonic anhydrase/acetyltransferase-like protein (isoleucine patch superfamily)
LIAHPSDDVRRAEGFLTYGEVLALCDQGVHVLDPSSCLVSRGVSIGYGARIYPNVVLEARDAGMIVVGTGAVMFPGTLLIASDDGTIRTGEACEFGPGGVQVKANHPGAKIEIGNAVRLLNGCEVTGVSSLGDGAQVIGAIAAQSVRLGGGRGGYRWPEPDERGAVLKGAGLARELTLRAGDVLNLTRSFASAAVERQSAYHPRVSRPST